MKKESREVDRQWKFERWIRQPVCLSIRANDPLSGFNRSLVSGDRLYVNMLVKFESLQVRPASVMSAILDRLHRFFCHMTVHDGDTSSAPRQTANRSTVAKEDHHPSDYRISRPGCSNLGTGTNAEIHTRSV